MNVITRCFSALRRWRRLERHGSADSGIRMGSVQSLDDEHSGSPSENSSSEELPTSPVRNEQHPIEPNQLENQEPELDQHSTGDDRPDSIMLESAGHCEHRDIAGRDVEVFLHVKHHGELNGKQLLKIVSVSYMHA